ncbi:MAG: hypothetical protein ACRC0G_07820 [Fusobacteriaceae bacterium]
MIQDSILTISDILASDEKWKSTYNFYNKILQDGFEDDDVILSKVRFKFGHDSEEEYCLFLTGFILNMALWKPFVSISKCVDIDYAKWDINHIINPENINKRVLIAKIDEIVVKPYRRILSNRDMNSLAYSITKCWKDIAEDYGPLLAISINIFDEIAFCNENDEYRDMLHTDIPPDMQAKDIETFVKERCSRVISMIKDNPEHCLSPILISGEGIKQKQFKEYSTCVGTKPNGQGGIHPLPVNTSFIRGHRQVSDFFIDSTSGRIAQIIQRRNVSSSGAFARQLGLLAVEVQLHDDPTYDCGSKHRIEFDIKTKNHLKGINGMYICHLDNKGDELKHEFLLDLDEKDYSFLIGTTVLLRTAVTCASKMICHKCYGDLAYTNNDIKIGLFASTELTEKLTQIMLSAKHLLESDAIEILLSLLVSEPSKSLITSYKDIFTFNMDTIRLNEDNLDLLERFKLVVGENDLEEEEVDSDIKEENDTKIFVRSFKLIDDLGMSYEVTCSNPMYLSDELVEHIQDNVVEDGYSEVALSDLANNENLALAYVSLQNNEISKTFNELKSVIGSEKSVCEHTLHSMYNALCDVIINAGFDLMLVHASVIMRPLVRSKYDVLKMPNWQLRDYRSEYVLLGLQRAIMKDPSVVNSLAFERLRGQLVDPATFRKRQHSTYDVLFKIQE